MKQQFFLDDILNFDQRYRATFINSLGGFKSVALIGTVNGGGQTNLAIFNSLFHLGANPPLFGLMVRPNSVERHTLNNILETGEFTVNHITENFYKQAHQTSARYAHNISEFDATGLTAEYKEHVKAPFVKESNIQIGAEFLRKIDINENGTIIIIAKITSVTIPQNCIGTDGCIDIEKAGTITCAGLDGYYTTSRLARLSYAKADTLPQILKH
jgi:flavin reductase (DIM6/NTAB) family NADH-FMN oxidoreductase RutF